MKEYVELNIREIGPEGYPLFLVECRKSGRPYLATKDLNCIINEALAAMREGNNVRFVSEPIDGRESRKVSNFPHVPCACCGEAAKFEYSLLQSIENEFGHTGHMPEVEYALC